MEEQQIRVFIADASQESVELLEATLAREADIVIVGTTLRGDDALLRFPQCGADLLLTDLLLPGLDGVSLLRELRESGVLKHAIVLSAFFNDGVARLVGTLADYYLTKPCGAQRLVQRIRECVWDGAFSPLRGDDTIVSLALMECGVPSHLDGFSYLRESIVRTVADRSLLHGVTKALYRDVAKHFGTTAACVERSMRSAIEAAWRRTSPEARRLRFGALFDASGNAPSNVPFLSAMTEYVLLQLSEGSRFGSY